MPESRSAATDLDLISYLKAIPDARMRWGVRIPAWYLLLVAVLGIMSGCKRLHKNVTPESEGFDNAIDTTGPHGRQKVCPSNSC